LFAVESFWQYAGVLNTNATVGKEVSVVNTLNLASKPFSNRFLPWLLTSLILFISVVSLLFIARATANNRRQSEAVQLQSNSLKQKEHELLKAAEEVKNDLTADQQKALPAAHVLVDRKQFSWSRLLADLESSLPGSVRVSRIAVRNVTKQGDQTVADLELAVFAKSPEVITAMIADMNKSGVYKATLNSQNLQKGRGEIGTEYELGVVYQPRPGFAIERVAALDRAADKEEAK
jgi:Tfp pilus assembly protein PilN